jgi:Na+/H+-dicarboxylate symporter
MKIQNKVKPKRTSGKSPGSIAIYIGIAVVFGSIVGAVFGSRVAFLGELGILLIRLLKALATPLVFFAIVDAFCKTQIQPRSARLLVTISALNALVAGTIAIVLSDVFPIGLQDRFRSLMLTAHPEAPAVVPKPAHFDLLKALGNYVPQNILEPFLTNNVISVVILAVLVGLIFRKLRQADAESSEIKTLESFFSGGLQLVAGLLGWMVKAIPLAVFGVVAKMVGESGFELFTTLGMFVGLVATGIFIHVGIYYSFILLFVARKSPLIFFHPSGEALMTAFGTGSSLATLPVTLRALQGKMKISVESSRLAACIGTNLNHDGILLYEAAAALFIAQVQGIEFSFGQKLIVLLSSAFAAVGMAGVPEAGLITLSLVLSAVGLPLTYVPILMTVDWLIGRLRATANVTSDMVVATLLDRFRKA